MHRTILFLGVAGTLFSGYLAGTKLLSGSCALNQPCPYFLGYPACYYGFALFFVLTFVAFFLVRRTLRARTALTVILFVALVGVVFAGYFTLQELPTMLREGIGAYVASIPTCAMGFVVFILVAAVSARARSRARYRL